MPSLLSVYALQVVFLTVSFANTTAVDADVVLASRKLQAALTATRLGMHNSTSDNYRVTKPGCRAKCGNVTVPYPFGMGSSNCYRDSRFKITCNYSYNSPVSYLNTLHRQYEVLQITPDYVHINILAPVICDTDNITSITSKLIDSSTQLSEPDLDGTIFTISNRRNKLMVLGCNIYDYIITIQKLQYNEEMPQPSSGCASRCSGGLIESPYSCVGSGCCKVSIPMGLTQFSLHTNRIAFGSESVFAVGKYASHGPCSQVNHSRVFLVDQEFSGVVNLMVSKNDSFVPMVLEWAISDETKDYDGEDRIRFPTCGEARKYPSSYACGQNTDCLKSESGSGYRCKCLTGYAGNPYLLLGCQDIDECKELSKCGKEGICVNAPGSYKCECSPGLTLEINEKGYLCMPGEQRLAANPKDKRRLPIAIIISSGIGGSTILIVLVGTAFWSYNGLEKRKQMKLKQKHFTRNGGLLLQQKITSDDGRIEMAAKIFVTEELKKTTDNFNPSRIIGKGGFGTVYKGMLSNGEIVAIKKSTVVDKKQVDQFINEVVILSQINHRHIVKLLGCCLETQVPLLVYEFVSNGTLAYHLHTKEENESLLSWKDRMLICQSTDIKSTNILLDEKYKAKVADFGISRSIPVDSTHLTTQVQGTFGFLDPQYFRSSQFTDKSDVYSSGVVLVELLTGERAVSQIRDEEEMSLVLYFINSMKENRLSEILVVFNEAEIDDVLVVAKLANRCLKYVGKKRPSMKEVSLTLSGLQEKLSRDPFKE
ncbi:hypothetical protein MKX01_022011 [Papaver californicum]|nr:hypothetical protein MKX01_022011 [Papaver californicum]